MSATKELWMAEYEQIPDDYTGAILRGNHPEDARAEAAQRLRALGFRNDELQEHLEMLDA